MEEETKKTEKLKKESVKRGIIKRHGFSTTDGKLWEEQDVALAHQRNIDFVAWYDEPENWLLTHGGDDSAEPMTVPEVEMADWLLENKKAVLDFLGE